MRKNIVFYIILLISIFGAIFFGIKIYNALIEYKKGNDIYNEISEIAHNQKSMEPTVSIANTTEPISVFEQETVTPTTSHVIATYSVPTQVPEQNITQSVELIITPEKKRSSMNFDGLLAINEDVKGWIRLDDSKVDYPVLQYSDNDFYLHHAITGEWNKVGTPYIDYRCAGNFTDRITVIYGHYMENGTMFTDFHKYKSQKYYEDHPVINLYTPDGDYDILPVAGVFQNVEYWDFTLDFDTDESFLHYIDNWKAVSTFRNNVTYNSSDKFVVLTLCTYDIENGRYLLVGMLVPKD